MNLQQIKYFLAAIDTGTFLAASEQVHVSQPTLSSGIKKLEESLGVKLFYRGSRSLTLTAEGELFHSKAREAFNQLEYVRSALKGSYKKINIGVINTISMDHIADIIKAYKQAKPAVFIEIIVGSSELLSKLLMTQKIDYLFSSKLDIAAKFELLFKEPLNLAVSTKNPLAQFNSIEITQLQKHKFIERIRCESWDSVHELINKYDLELQSICSAENDETILSLVSVDLGVSIMPVRKTPYDVKFIKIKEINILRNIGIYSNENVSQNNTLYNIALGVCKKYNEQG
ncbi:MAG TPA: LysR family transcriptional regulator [Gammaproteobacteria bacterium]|nr:LysR family transcriptional regulator [Gammaproteobacteria bacterium]